MEHCYKCDGSGFLIEYAGIQEGKCFACGGVKTRTSKELRALKIEKKASQKAWDQKQKELYELKGTVARLQRTYESVQAAALEELEEMEMSEEELKILGSFVKRRYAAWKKAEKQLEELQK